MQPQQIAIVQQTFAQATPLADELATRFYERLFTLDPGLRPLFRSEPKHQRQKLVAALTFVVHGLHEPETILHEVRRLGQRHAGYGVQPSHYATVGQALIDTLALLFGPAFTSEVADAWAAAYGLLVATMQQAADEPAILPRAVRVAHPA